MAQEQQDQTAGEQSASTDTGYQPSYYAPSYERPSYATTSSDPTSLDSAGFDSTSLDPDGSLTDGWKPTEWQPPAWDAAPPASASSQSIVPDPGATPDTGSLTAAPDASPDAARPTASAGVAEQREAVQPGAGGVPQPGASDPSIETVDLSPQPVDQPPAEARLASSNAAMADMLPTTGTPGSGTQHSVWQAAVPDRTISGAVPPASTEPDVHGADPDDATADLAGPLPTAPRDNPAQATRAPYTGGELPFGEWKLGYPLQLTTPEERRFRRRHLKFYGWGLVVLVVLGLLREAAFRWAAPTPVWTSASAWPPTAASEEPTTYRSPLDDAVQAGDVLYEQVGTHCGPGLGAVVPGGVKAARGSTWCVMVVVFQGTSRHAAPGPTDAVLSDGRRTIVANRALTLADDKDHVLNHGLKDPGNASYWFVVPSTFTPTRAWFEHDGQRSAQVRVHE